MDTGQAEKLIRDLQEEIKSLNARVAALQNAISNIAFNSEEIKSGSIGNTMPSIGELRGTFRKDQENRSI